MGLQCEWFRSFRFRTEQRNALDTFTESGGFLIFFFFIYSLAFETFKQLPYLARNIEASTSILIILRGWFYLKRIQDQSV